MTRPLSADERSIIETLLSKPFPGRDSLRAQLDFTRVTGLSCDCGCGSLSLAVEPGAPRATVIQRVPCDGHGYDASGENVGVLLFVDDGHISCLEFYGQADSFGPPQPETVEAAEWSEADEHGVRRLANERPLHQAASTTPGDDDDDARRRSA